jgi:hypothetical protein
MTTPTPADQGLPLLLGGQSEALARSPRSTDGAWVVMTASMGNKTIWAWGRVSTEGAGFEEVFFTEDDGYTPVAAMDRPPRLTTHLFTVRVPWTTQ